MAVQTDTLSIAWAEFCLVLIFNIVAMVIPIRIESKIIQNLIKPFTTSIFLMEALFFLLPGAPYGDSKFTDHTAPMICVIFVIFFAALDIFIQPKRSESKKTFEQTIPAESQHQLDPNQKSTETHLNPESQETNTPASNMELDNEQPHPPPAAPASDNDSQPTSEIRIITAITFVIIWVTYMMRGMLTSCAWRHQEYEINVIFSSMFHYPTLTYVFGMFAMNDNPPKWLYWLYMIPQAILYPVALIASYYSNKPTEAMASAGGAFFGMTAGALCYVGFRLMYQFQEYFRNETDMKNRLIQAGVLILGFLWMCLILGIDLM